MIDWLAAAAQANPDAVALMFEDRAWTYRQLHQEVNTLCSWLVKLGVSSGHHIAVLMPNRPEYVMLIHALMRLGAVLVPLNLRLTSDELRYQVDKSQVTLLICSDETRDTATTLADLCPTISIDSEVQVEVLMIPPREVDFAAPHAIVFTSGTTGRPKGAVLTYGNHFWGATASAFRIGTLPEDRWLCCLPLYHVGGLNIITRCCIYGTTVVLHRAFDVKVVRDTLSTQKIALISLVPTMLYRLTASPLDAPNLRLILLGGAAASIELLERCGNLPISTTYGLTEADSQVATQTPESTRRKPGSVGKALPYTTIHILDVNGESVPAGVYGEIVISSPTIMQGYFNDPGATQRVLREDGLHTGDIGYLDDDGDLWIVQRRSDLIVTGGENVYPAEVEAVIREHPAVEEVCVVGIASLEWGQQVTAAVVLHSGRTLTEAKLINFCRKSLAGYKIPRVIRFVDQLPLTASGKIERKAVQAMFGAGDLPTPNQIT